MDTNYYEHQPQNVINLGKTTIFWDKTIFTDSTIMTSRPDIIIHDKEQHLFLTVDVKYNSKRGREGE